MNWTLDEAVEQALSLVQGGLFRLPPEERLPYLRKVTNTLHSMAVALETEESHETEPK